MKTKTSLALFSLLVFLAGCTSLQTGGEVQAGRQALLKGSNETALGYFYSVGTVGASGAALSADDIILKEEIAPG